MSSVKEIVIRVGWVSANFNISGSYQRYDFNIYRQENENCCDGDDRQANQDFRSGHATPLNAY
jgi:hypothetical protein